MSFLPKVGKWKLYLGLAVVTTILGVGGGWKINEWRRDAQLVDQLSAELATAEQAVADAYAHSEQVSQRAVKSLELQHELEKERDRLRGDNRRISQRLSRLLAEAPRPAPTETAAGPAEPTGPAGDGSGAGAPSTSDGGDRSPAAQLASAIGDDVIPACRADALDVVGWQRWYESVPCELKAEGCQ